MSALVDGQLDPADAERMWAHVLGCRSCRARVAQEGRVKTEVAGLGLESGGSPPAHLVRSLHSMHDLAAWAVVDEIERTGGGRRRAGLAILGAGSVSVAVIGFASLSGATLGIGSAPVSTPTSSLSRPGTTRTPANAVIAPFASVHGRLPATVGEPTAVVPGLAGVGQDRPRERAGGTPATR